MSIQAAMAFIAHCEGSLESRRGLEALARRGADLDEVTAFGARLGYSFTPEELREAHEREWHMRRAFYAGAATTFRSSD